MSSAFLGENINNKKIKKRKSVFFIFYRKRLKGFSETS